MKVKKLIAELAVLSAIVVAVASISACIMGYMAFALAAVVTAPIGLVGLGLLVKDVSEVFKDGSVRKIVFKFIFRLACFAILLYVLLVRLRLNPLGVALGITLPVFCMLAIALKWANKLSDKNTK